MQRFNGCLKQLAACIVVLTLMLVGAQALFGQTVTRTVATGSHEATLTITPSEVSYQLYGDVVTLPRDLAQAATVRRAQTSLWDLDMLITLSEHRDGPIDYPALGGDLGAALDSLEALLTQAASDIEALRAERDDALAARDAAASQLAAATAEADALRAEQAAALVRVRGWIDAWQMIRP